MIDEESTPVLEFSDLLDPFGEDAYCPHGNPVEACQACDALADLAFDAEREDERCGCL